MEKWYVAHSKPRNEELLWKQYCMRNIVSYYPRIRVNPVNPRCRKWLPYFPGYLFVHADLDQLGVSILEWAPGSAGLVSFGDGPASIAESVVHSIQQCLESLNKIVEKKSVQFNKGDHVLINEGIFKGYEAIMDFQLSGMERVRVLLSLIGNRQIPVELPVSYVSCTNQQ